MKPTGKEPMMNRAEAAEPKSGHKPPANRGSAHDVGNERKAQVTRVQEGGSMAEAAGNKISEAVRELKSQHPHEYHEHGPHHGTTEHIRHQPLHGLKPSPYGR